ncbi:MAG TPA: hypothetical protein VL442_03100 [Mucilaginibacter sp.]|jgi:hypothetical protein|nr:hypothetical protein [Mucilaginibacter sp.]
MDKYHKGITGLGRYPFFIVPDSLFFNIELFIFLHTEFIGVFDHLDYFKIAQLDQRPAYSIGRFPGHVIDFAIYRRLVDQAPESKFR